MSPSPRSLGTLLFKQYSSLCLSGKESACNAGDMDMILGSGRSRPMEKEMATHHSTLAWEIPWTEEPGGLQSKRLQRVRYDLVTKNNRTTNPVQLVSL